MGIKIFQICHTASQIDKSFLKPVGKCFFPVSRGNLNFSISALVTEQTDCDILAGVPFFLENNIIIDIPGNKLMVDGKTVIPCCNNEDKISYASFRYRQTYVLRSAKENVIISH